jgi:hypothetical protein
MYLSDAYWCSYCDRTHVDECEASIRTPKAGETWVWKPCERHRFKQLRDVVFVGRDYEDLPEDIQRDVMEHLVCGCQYAADDPERAIADLRHDEAKHKAEMLAKVAAIVAEPPKRRLPWRWFLVGFIGWQVFFWLGWLLYFALRG